MQTFRKSFRNSPIQFRLVQGNDQFYRRPISFIPSFNDSVLYSRIDPTHLQSSSSNSSGSSGSWSSGSLGSGSSLGGGGGGGW